MLYSSGRISNPIIFSYDMILRLVFDVLEGAVRHFPFQMSNVGYIRNVIPIIIGDFNYKIIYYFPFATPKQGSNLDTSNYGCYFEV